MTSVSDYICSFGCLRPCPQSIDIPSKTGTSQIYYVRKKLDSGGFSNIDLVLMKQTRKWFALKRIHCYSKEDETKALSEAYFHQSLPNHPNILPCYGVRLKPVATSAYGPNSEVLMVLEFASGGTVQKHLDQMQTLGKGFSSDLAIRLILGICEGLMVLLNLDSPSCHRDLKPGNVLIFDNWRPVLMDFGSVTPAIIKIDTYKDAEKWKEFAAENCSMAYRAPELFQPKPGQDIDDKADIWSLGCLFYALLFLQSPMDAVHARGDSVALAACSGRIQFPTDALSKISLELMNLIKSMLSPNPTHRPSLNDLIRILTSFVSNPTPNISSSQTANPDAPSSCTIIHT